MDDNTTFERCPLCKGQLHSRTLRDPETGLAAKCERCDGVGHITVPVRSIGDAAMPR
jgi:hypothetical protein